MNTAPAVSPAEVEEKWREISPLIDRLMVRAGAENEFQVRQRSALAGDDRGSAPYQVSYAFRQCLNAAIDHLHAAKLLVVDLRVVHLAAPASLARSALENAATAYWILEPRRRDERIMRALRWQSRNIRDQHTAATQLSPTPLQAQLGKVAAVAAARGLSPEIATSGYKQSTVMAEVAQATGLHVDFVWQLCSGFTHGRPWGLSRRPAPAEDADCGPGRGQRAADQRFNSGSLPEPRSPAPDRGGVATVGAAGRLLPSASLMSHRRVSSMPSPPSRGVGKWTPGFPAGRQGLGFACSATGRRRRLLGAGGGWLHVAHA